MSNASIAQGSLVYVAPRPCNLPQPAILSCRWNICQDQPLVGLGPPAPRPKIDCHQLVYSSSNILTNHFPPPLLISVQSMPLMLWYCKWLCYTHRQYPTA